MQYIYNFTASASMTLSKAIIVFDSYSAATVTVALYKGDGTSAVLQAHSVINSLVSVALKICPLTAVAGGSLTFVQGDSCVLFVHMVSNSLRAFRAQNQPSNIAYAYEITNPSALSTAVPPNPPAPGAATTNRLSIQLT